jgi:hypothetical protein
VWLFPATYLVHIAEEYFGDLPSLAADFTGFPVTNAAFLVANAIFWFLMVGTAAWAVRSELGAQLVVVLATIIIINAVLHGGGTLLTRSYSPGLISGALLWLPLGVFSLVRGKRVLVSSAFRTAVALGVAIHALVPLVGLGLVLALS